MIVRGCSGSHSGSTELSHPCGGRAQGRDPDHRFGEASCGGGAPPEVGSHLCRHRDRGGGGKGSFAHGIDQLPILLGEHDSLLSLTSGMGIGSTLIDERNNGILDRIRAHPVRRKEYLLGKIMGNGIIGFTQGLIMILVTTLAFDVHWGGRPLALGLIILLLTFISCALGILFSTLMSSSGALTAAMTILLWFMSFVSGGFTGEPVLGAVGRFTVNHYAFEGIAALMRGGGISEVAGNMGILGLIALVLWVVGLIGFHRRFSYE